MIIIEYDQNVRRFRCQKDKGPVYYVDMDVVKEIAYQEYKRHGTVIRSIQGNEQFVYDIAVRESQYVDFEEVPVKTIQV